MVSCASHVLEPLLHLLMSHLAADLLLTLHLLSGIVPLHHPILPDGDGRRPSLVVAVPLLQLGSLVLEEAEAILAALPRLRALRGVALRGVLGPHAVPAIVVRHHAVRHTKKLLLLVVVVEMVVRGGIPRVKLLRVMRRRVKDVLLLVMRRYSSSSSSSSSRLRLLLYVWVVIEGFCSRHGLEARQILVRLAGIHGHHPLHFSLKHVCVCLC